jgi:hypothetical protein
MGRRTRMSRLLLRKGSHFEATYRNVTLFSFFFFFGLPAMGCTYVLFDDAVHSNGGGQWDIIIIERGEIPTLIRRWNGGRYISNISGRSGS